MRHARITWPPPSAMSYSPECPPMPGPRRRKGRPSLLAACSAVVNLRAASRDRQRRHPYRRGQAGRGRGPQRHPRFREAVHGNAGRNHGTGRLHDRRVRAYPARFSQSVGLRLRVADCGEQCRGREQPGACPPYCYGRGSDGWLEDGYSDERFRGDGRFRLPDEQGSGLGRAGFLPAGRDGQGCGAPQRPL